MYLASKSPQRKALLESLGLDFQIVVPDYHEEDLPHELPAERVERHSRGKAFSVLGRLEEFSSGRPVLGVDTIVVFGGKATGKAGSEEEARILLKKMSGRTHLVYSGVTLLTTGSGPGERDVQTAHAVTEVKFSTIPEEEIFAYVATGEWRQRAGAYAIQGRASAYVESIKGDYSNVVGLPVPLLVEMLRARGNWPPESWRSLR